MVMQPRRGDIMEALYINVSEEKVHKTTEVLWDVLLVDRDLEGNLMGIEILGPMKITAVSTVGDDHNLTLRLRLAC